MIVTGQPEDVAAAKADLLALVPVSKTINIPLHHHRHIIGAGGRGIRELMEDTEVNIKYVVGVCQSVEYVRLLVLAIFYC